MYDEGGKVTRRVTAGWAERRAGADRQAFVEQAIDFLSRKVDPGWVRLTQDLVVSEDGSRVTMRTVDGLVVAV